MSSLIIEVSQIDDIRIHPNADALEIAGVKGWDCIIKKGQYKVGDKIVFVPPDSIVPKEWTDKWGATPYVGSGGRVKATRLRGTMSFGLIAKVEDESWPMGTDVASYYNITKYEPPITISCGDASRHNPLFQFYTDMENIRNFKNLIPPDEEVVATEKIHGTNSRIAIIDGEMMAGSKGLDRYKPENDDFKNSTYWYPWSIPEVYTMMHSLARVHKSVILYGEIFGSKIQKSLPYGRVGVIDYAVFDLMLDNEYQNYDMLQLYCQSFQVKMAPIVYRGLFDFDKMKKISMGNSLISTVPQIREGVVIKPVVERKDNRHNRVILKMISDDYTERKFNNKIDDSTDA